MDFSFSQLMMPALLSLGQKGSENFPKFFSTSFPFSQVQMSSRWCSHALRNSQDFWESHQTSLLGMWPRPGSMASPESHSTSPGFGGKTRRERGSPFYPPFPRTLRIALKHSVYTCSPGGITSPMPGSSHQPRGQGDLMRAKHGRVWANNQISGPKV